MRIFTGRDPARRHFLSGRKHPADNPFTSTRPIPLHSVGKEGATMQEKTFANFFEFPSGDVMQAFKQWTSLWSDMMNQVGLVNINLAQSSDAVMERRIVGNVASYGRQLGRISEVLEALLAHTDRKEWSTAQLKAFEDFRELSDRIAAEKGAHLAPTRANVDRFLEGIRQLKDTDNSRYREIVDRLKTELLS
jgi:hypothetical protein